MMARADRYDRNIRLFGEEGQRRLSASSAVIVGVSGLGTPLAQHLGLLGAGKIGLIDDEELDDTNRNRVVCARDLDPVPGSAKVALAARMISEINAELLVTPLKANLVSPEAFDMIKNADWVFGCFDDDGPRFILNELCAAYGKSYIDLASDIPEAGIYGGRVCIATDGQGCVYCLGQLDNEDVRRYLATEEQLAGERAVYGVPTAALGTKGPSVAPVNGVVASLAATEFMVAITGIRRPTRLLEYRGHVSKVVVNTDEPRPNCYYCKGVRGVGAAADVERYLLMPHLVRRRD